MKRVSIETKVWIIHTFSITCCKEKKATYTIKNSSYRWSKSCSDHFFVMKKKKHLNRFWIDSMLKVSPTWFGSDISLGLKCGLGQTYI